MRDLGEKTKGEDRERIYTHQSSKKEGKGNKRGIVKLT